MLRISLKLLSVIFVVLMLSSCGVIIGPKVGHAPDIKTIEATPERLERGEYLANYVAGCTDCHSTRDWDYFAGPVVPGTAGKGGEYFGEEMDIPGKIYASNITPAAIGDWTDGELVRAIVSGVNKDGDALFPIMPYANFARLPEDDIYSIVAYIRTLKPIPNEIPKRKIKFPVNLFIRRMPKRYSHQTRPDTSDKIAYGEHVTTIAGCADCHTPMKRGKPIKGMEFAGGNKFPFPGEDMHGTTRSANITPHIETGIGEWTEEAFVERFKKFAGPDGKEIVIHEGHLGANTFMPWTLYAEMTEGDLRAIYAYLRTVKPIENTVKKYSPESDPD